jgi:hypothetical protein
VAGVVGQIALDPSAPTTIMHRLWHELPKIGSDAPSRWRKPRTLRIAMACSSNGAPYGNRTRVSAVKGALSCFFGLPGVSKTDEISDN